MSKPTFSRKRKGKKVDPYPLGGKGKSKSNQTKGSKGRPRTPKPDVSMTREGKAFLRLYDDIIMSDYTLEDVDNDLHHISDLAKTLKPLLSKAELKEAEAWAEAYIEDEEPNPISDPYVRLVAIDIAMRDGDYIWDDFGDSEVFEIVELVGKKLKGSQSPSVGEKPTGNYSVGEQVKIQDQWWEIWGIDEDGILEVTHDGLMETVELEPEELKLITDRKAK